MTLTPIRHNSHAKWQSPQQEADASSQLKLGILDSGLMSPGKTAAQTIKETLLSASLTDSLGYSRYWLTEHHNPTFAWGNPEILLILIAQHTKQIRPGTAGILLFFYSPLKIAEIFHFLEIVYPGRCDLGIAAGSLTEENEIVRILSSDYSLPPESRESRQQYYSEKVTSLIAYLSQGIFTKHSSANHTITNSPPIWLLGTGRGNMTLAAMRGTAFSYSLCHGYSKCDPSILSEYRSKFQSSQLLPAPKCNIAVAGICAETEVEARQQKLLFDRSFNGTTKINVVGTPKQCKEQLLEIQHQYQVDEIIYLSAAPSFAQRQLSYEMLAEVLNLSTVYTK